MRNWSLVVFGVTLGLTFGVACSGDDDPASLDDPSVGLRVAAFDFAESELLAELYAQAVERHGIPVERLGRVGPREIVAPALQLDQIDLVPEYLGTAAAHFGAVEQNLDGLSSALEPLGLLAYQPAAAQDVNAFVVTADTARDNDLALLSDLDDFAPGAAFGGPVECPERPLCLAGLRDTYGLTFAEFVPQRSLAVTADALLSGEIDIGLMFTTSAALASGPFVVLEDDRGLQPAENIVPVIRRSATDRWGPEVRRALDEMSGALTTDELRVLNQRVENGEPFDAVASSWLTQSTPSE